MQMDIEHRMAKNTFRVSGAVTAAILFFFALSIRLLFPYAEWNLDANNLLRAVIYADLHGVQAGGVSMRYWYQDNLYQWWLDVFLPVKELVNPVSTSSIMQLLSVASMLPKILGALNISLVFLFMVALGADRKISLILSAICAITAQHVMLSSIVERQVISQTFLIASFLLPTLAMRNSVTRYAVYILSLGINIFGIICYSPPIMFFPFLLLFIISLEIETTKGKQSYFRSIITVFGIMLCVDTVLYFATGASVASVLIGSLKFFLMYADPASQDEFSKIDENMIFANITWLFGHLFQWLPYYRSDNFNQISIWAALLSGTVVSYIFYCAVASIVPFRKHMNTKIFEFLCTNDARLGILSAAFLVGIAFTLVVRHGNQTEFYIMPYTFILPVIAARISRNQSKSQVGIVMLCLVGFLVALSINGNPFIGASFEARNSYILQNSAEILPTMVVRP